ncbi:MAG: hypothetical protein KAT05_11810 [Spirochaetes bacterium]|nr:hypothetical protein [Spirochaetota bacterium]
MNHITNQKIFLIVFCLLVISPIALGNLSEVRANPIVPPKLFEQLFMGLFSNGTDLQHVRSNVSIDVYDFESIGHGDYLLRNHNDTDVSVPICFVTGLNSDGFTNKNLNVSINGTAQIGEVYNERNFDYDNPDEIFTDGSLQEYINSSIFSWYEKEIVVFTLNISALNDALFSVDWNFISGIKEDYNPRLFSLKTDKHRFFYTGYKINGGKHWNNHSIESEQISFHFHTDKFLLDEQFILVDVSNEPWRKFEESYNEEWKILISKGKREILEDTTSGPIFSLEFTDIMEDINICIINDHSTVGLSYMGKILLGILAVAGISLIIIARKRHLKKKERLPC